MRHRISCLIARSASVTNVLSGLAVITISRRKWLCCFFFNDTATTEIYTRKDTLSLHDALPIWHVRYSRDPALRRSSPCEGQRRSEEHTSELQSPFLISYAVFCLKKKKHNNLHHCSHIYANNNITNYYIYVNEC